MIQSRTSLEGRNFNDLYFRLHEKVVNSGSVVKSRNGDTAELLNFQTVLRFPNERFIGGRNRKMNPFFLLAESVWIWCGRRDVAFMDIFNSKLKNYSDDGKYYNAPYGWRLRKYGIDSMQIWDDSNKYEFDNSIDQIRVALNKLHNDPNDRRVVASIWNPDLDLDGKLTKDTPCNDMLMFKIREGRLYQTIQNRSNDLDWGLSTNIFQFSFIGEIMSKILGVELGDQVHNSQSLHLYLDNPLTKSIENKSSDEPESEFYRYAHAVPIDFDFTGLLSVDEKLERVDFFLKGIISNIMTISKKKDVNEIITDDLSEFVKSLAQFSGYFLFVFLILMNYTLYKNKLINKEEAFHAISTMFSIDKDLNFKFDIETFKCSDITLSCLNFLYIPGVDYLKDVDTRILYKDSKNFFNSIGTW